MASSRASISLVQVHCKLKWGHGAARWTHHWQCPAPACTAAANHHTTHWFALVDGSEYSPPLLSFVVVSARIPWLPLALYPYGWNTTQLRPVCRWTWMHLQFRLIAKDWLPSCQVHSCVCRCVNADTARPPSDAHLSCCRWHTALNINASQEI